MGYAKGGLHELLPRALVCASTQNTLVGGVGAFVLEYVQGGGCMSKKINAIKKPIPVQAYQTDKPLDIKTLEGTMHANAGDWIITGPDGEQWPVKKEIFEKTYSVLN